MAPDQGQGLSPLLALSPALRRRVLSYLSLEEAGRLRAVSRALAAAAEALLTDTFLGLGARLQARALQLRAEPRFSFHMCLVVKALYLAELEYRLLRAAVGRYLREGACCFFGGRLLDLLEHVLRLSWGPLPPADQQPTEQPPPGPGLCLGRFRDLVSTEALDELSALVERYICFFETEVEPRLAAPAQLGVKALDVLDCSLGASSDLELETAGGWRSLRARLCCPLAGVLFCEADPEPAARHALGEAQAAVWLADVRELVRKSGQRYVGGLVRELSDVRCRRKPEPLFAQRRSLLAAGAADGRPLRERVLRRPLRPPPPAPDRPALSLRVALRLRFPLEQRPLDADAAGAEQCEAADGWGQAAGDGALPSLPPAAGDADPRAAFWLQLELHRSPPGAADGPADGDGPVAGLAGPGSERLLLSFQPARFHQFRWPALFRRAPSVALRDVCVCYGPPPHADVLFTYDRVRRLPGEDPSA